MTDRKRLFLLIGIMTTVALAVTMITIYILYTASFREQKARLLETCHSQARLLESIASYARQHTPDRWKEATLTQITNAHRRYEGFGRTGEFTLAHRQGDQIVFLLRHRHYDLSNPEPVPFRGADSDTALPMRLALLDSSGVVVGPDYRNAQVLAAHEPVADLNWGIVAKIDLAEIRAPFVRAGAIAVLITLLLASGGAWVSLRLSTPVIEHLEESAARTEAILETATEGIITTDEHGVVASFNRAAEEIFGYDRTEVVGEHVSMLAPDDHDDPQDASLADAMTDPDCTLQPGERHVIWKGREITGQCRDESTFPLYAAISAVVVNDQCILTGIVRDITEQKRTEEQLRRAREQLEERVEERTAELESFAYSVSHDLRTPLRAIDGYTRILREEHTDQLDDEGRRLLDIVYDSAQTMGALIDDLLTLSRVGRREMKSVRIDMEALAREAYDDLKRARPEDTESVRFDCEELPPAWGDRSMVRHVFTNLLSNALKFSRREEAPQIEVGATEDDGEPVYFVRDNGVGFDEAYVDKAFDVFQRLHGEEEFEGTGVGLALVERILQRHDGRAWAEGAEGEGATVFFTLPGPSPSSVEAPRTDESPRRAVA